MNIKFMNALIITMDKDNSIYNNANLYIIDDIIQGVSQEDDLAFKADKIIDAHGAIIMPGFINAFSRGENILFSSVNADEARDIAENENNYKIFKKMAPEYAYWGTLLSTLQAVKSGITTIFNVSQYPTKAIEALDKVGIRAFVPLINTAYEQEEIMQQKRVKFAGNYSDLCKEICFCRGVNQASDKQIENAISYSKKYKLLSTICCSETLEEVGECAKNNRDMSPVAYLEYLGFFDYKSSIIYGTNIDKDDISILQSYNVSVIATPSSNALTGSGITPIQQLMNHNIVVALGTDGSIVNNGIDMFREMAFAGLMQKVCLNDSKALPAIEILRMATVNGAKALNLDSVGIIKQGYKADLIMIDTKNIIDTNNIYSWIVYSAKSSDVIMTMVNGNVIYFNNKFTNCSDQEILKYKDIEINF